MDAIGIIGAGQMGSGIAQNAAASGLTVLLADREQSIADAARDGIAKRFARLVSKDKISETEADAAMQRIQPVSDYGAMDQASFIIEAATEREDIKQAIFAEAGKVLRSDAILASNTSSISITRMGANLPDPSRFIGLHFFNPVPVMELIEIIPGLATSQESVAKTRAFAELLGKKIVMSEDEPGFVVNRILLPMINEAIFVLGQGTANVADIDKGCRLGLNHPMGPLQLADFIGLDTCLEIMRVIFESTGDSKYRPAPMLMKYVDAGWLGRKSKRGFYDYSGEEPVPTR
ncbi:3-hydroxyacyl-CoA dehydrogenase NAD-binding domain-containing protein [Altericroceibacterium endophyticum]|uniref:3-hydroxybutyryl-CoA dehydrogenase n=1 Tax=Altericroceibacterium endophyticum TaxID=1808508 RepID=A0A6I4T6N2_9SPHN|nr:3-hydroxyacyl-CoA dehydrogenase NAD-binding domain-containing protein [Altericroceibacterium endophyticum]MXO65465.1 3-hydroxybutyryl-CoA dehydrogenase [Altericroceibacterium endophyticum]